MVVYPHYPLLIENEICYLHLNVSKGEKTEKMDGENDSRSSYLNLDQSIGINALQNISFQRQLRARGRRLFQIPYLFFLISTSFSFSLALSFFIVLLIWSSCLDNFSPDKMISQCEGMSFSLSYKVLRITGFINYLGQEKFDCCLAVGQLELMFYF